MTKRKRNLFSELMDGISAMRAYHKERRNVGKEILDGVREIKLDERRSKRRLG